MTAKTEQTDKIKIIKWRRSKIYKIQLSHAIV
jgi:hypothetical protein